MEASNAASTRKTCTQPPEGTNQTHDQCSLHLSVYIASAPVCLGASPAPLHYLGCDLQVQLAFEEVAALAALALASQEVAALPLPLLFEE
eukprot:2372875-Amphidinium_carterae.2